MIDVTGQPPRTGFVEFRKGDPLECSASGGHWHQLEDGAVVRFIDATPALAGLIGREFAVSIVDSTPSVLHEASAH